MKTCRNIIFAIMALAVFACSKPEAPGTGRPQDAPAVDSVPVEMTFGACLEGTTRVVFDGTGKSLWEADDKISIYDGEDNRCFEAGEAGESTTFTGQALEADVYYAHYPYSDEISFADGAILTSIPAVQTAVKGSFDADAAVAVACAAKEADLAFRNLASMLMFTVPADLTLTSVTIAGKGSEKIAGDVSVTFGQDGNPVIADAGDAATALSLTGEMTDGTYYVLVRPGNYSGLTVTVTDNNGKTAVFGNDAAVVLNRSACRDLGTVSMPESVTAPEFVFLGLAPTVGELDPESKAAAEWMLETFDNSAYLQIAKLPETDLSQCEVMWWHYHKDWGLDNKFEEYAADAMGEAVMAKVKEYRNDGGALFLSRYATYWAPVLDMVGGEWKYPGTIFGGTETGESGWLCGGKAEIFSTVEVAGSPYFKNCTMDANDDNAWKVVLNDGEYYYSNQHCLYVTQNPINEEWTAQNGNILIAFENDRKKAVMWECTYNKTETAGKVVCFGSPLLDFYEYQNRWNGYHDNVYKVAETTLRHLAE